MNIKKLIMQNIADNMPDIDESTPIGAVMKYADSVNDSANIAAAEFLVPHQQKGQDESTA